MKVLSSFMVINYNGSDRVSFTYDTIDDETGDLVSTNDSRTFFVTDDDLRENIESIRAYVRDNKLSQ